MLKNLISRLLLMAVLLLTGAAALTACGDDDAALFPTGEARRTVLIYMVAQNSLSQNLLRDSLEIWAGRAHVSAEDRLLVFVDGRGLPALYSVEARAEEPRVVRRWAGDVASTSPEVLRDVLGWVKRNCPSREYALVMASHADGWLPATEKARGVAPRGGSRMRPFSFGIDSGADNVGSDSGPQMDIPDMAEAIAGAGLHLRYLFFDACLMQGLEVAYELRRVTDYVIGGPISIPGPGANYTHQLAKGLFSASPERDIIKTYREDVTDPAQAWEYDDWGIVLSALRTDRLEALAAALREALPASACAGGASADMGDVPYYQYYGWRYYYRPHSYDAAAALRRILPEEAQPAVLAALDEAIVAREATARFYRGPGYWDYADVPADYSGVSIFIPQEVYGQNVTEEYGNHNLTFRNTAWHSAAGWAATGW